MQRNRALRKREGEAMETTTQTTRYSLRYTDGGSSHETVKDALRAFLATNKRQCRVSEQRLDKFGGWIEIFGIGPGTESTWRGKFTRKEAQAALAA
jgi:hypothetical protein